MPYHVSSRASSLAFRLHPSRYKLPDIYWSKKDEPEDDPSTVTMNDLAGGLSAFAVSAGLSAAYSKHDLHQEALQIATQAYEAAVKTADITVGAENEKCTKL